MLNFQDMVIIIVAGRVSNRKMIGTNKPDRKFKTELLFWHRGNIRGAAQRKIGALLANPIESRIFDSLPTPTSKQSAEDYVCWVRQHDKLRPFFLFVPLLVPRYGIEGAYERAKSQSDGQYSPHTAFRSLILGDVLAAVGFVNEFGPLEILDEGQPRKPLRQEDLLAIQEVDGEGEPTLPERCAWVDVEDFLDKHRRFVGVVELWESRENYAGMVMALSKLAALSVSPPIGAWRAGQSYSIANPFPWENGRFHEWMRKANKERVMQTSSEIIKQELDLQAHEMDVRWRRPDPSRLAFQLAPHPKSLWMAIWHLFARDTTEGLGWRICPHCSRVFYPKRKDSYFCQSKYQKLHAANRWWKEHSEEELDKRRKVRTKAQTRRKKATHKFRTRRRD